MRPLTDAAVVQQHGRFEWSDDSTVEFHLSHGDWIRQLPTNGFEIEDLIELRPGDGTHSSASLVTAAWAKRWPCEEAWRARRR